MQELPVHPEKSADHFMALSRKRDIWLKEMEKDPERSARTVETLTVECVTETLLLTGVSISREEVSRVAESAGVSQNLPVILGQFQALEALKEEARSSSLLSTSLVCDVNRLSSPSSGGRFRRGAARPQFAGATPSRPEMVADKVRNLVDWLAANSGRSLHLPVRAALAFVRLLEISPFEGGNFRTAHLLLNFFAFAERFPPFFLRAKDADELRKDIEQALAFDTAPLVARFSRAQAQSLSYCLETAERQ